MSDEMSNETQALKTIGLPVRHYSNTFSAPLYHKMTDDFGKSNTDTSKWRPDISLIHSQSLGNSGLQPVYDFPNGRDDPDKWTTTFIRTKGLDITEVDRALEVSKGAVERKQKRSEKTSDDVMKENIQKLADKLTSETDSDAPAPAPAQ